MPRKKMTKTRKRRPRRKTYSLSRMGIPSGILPTQRVKLRYCDSTSLTSTGGALNYATYRANGPFDPRVAFAGLQPMAWDTWTTLYNYYIVESSKITITVMDSSSQVEPYIIGLYLDDNNSVPYINVTGYIEAGKGTYRIATGKQATPLRIKSSFNTKRFFNVTDPKDNKFTLGANVTADPTNQAYYMFYLQSLNISTNTVLAIITIDYTISFSEPKSLSQS